MSFTHVPFLCYSWDHTCGELIDFSTMVQLCSPSSRTFAYRQSGNILFENCLKIFEYLFSSTSFDHSDQCSCGPPSFPIPELEDKWSIGMLYSYVYFTDFYFIRLILMYFAITGNLSSHLFILPLRVNDGKMKCLRKRSVWYHF